MIPNPPAASSLAAGAVGARTSGRGLPRPATPFIGRETELKTIADYLANSDCRLLTLLGPGGIGKTRLALESATRQQATGRVAWVPLDAVTDPASIAAAIADAFGLLLQDQGDPDTQVLNYLRQEELLLVLDNLEHLLAGADFLSQLMQTCPTVTILATSRERLNLEEEWVVTIGGLDVPAPPDAAGDAAPAIPLADLECYSALQMFMQRARRARASFQLTEEDVTAVVRCCWLVRGHPLSIELAASWVRMMTPAQIVTEIERNFDFLNSSMRNAAQRHQSVRVVFEYSWNLLTVEEQRVCRQLGVFVGGFRQEAAHAVAGASLAMLGALVDKSFLQVDATGRYELYRLLGQYVREKLVAVPGEADAVAERHIDYYGAFLQTRAADLKGARQKAALAEVSDEIENVRAGGAWAISHCRVAEIGQAMETLFQFYVVRDRYHEGDTLFGQAVAALDDPERAGDEAYARVLGGLLSRQGWFALRLGDSERARGLLQRSLSFLRPYGGRDEVARALATLGNRAYLDGEYAQAQGLYHESLTLGRAAGDYWTIALALRGQGEVAEAQGAVEEARDRYQESLALCRDLGCPSEIADSLAHLAMLLPPAEAEILLEESLALCREIDDPDGIARALCQLGERAAERGDPVLAQQLHGDALAIHRRIGYQHGMGDTFAFLGAITRRLGDFTKAEAHLHEALRIFMEIEAAASALGVLLEQARLRVSEGDPEGAVELLALLIDHPAAPQPVRDLAFALQDEIAPALAPETVKAAQVRGRARSLVATAEAILGIKLAESLEATLAVPQLQVTIDQEQKAESVSQITESEFFQDLVSQAASLRAKGAARRDD
jgi:predicted ATPase